MKTPERIIYETIGLSLNSKDLTPMDKGECIKCMIADRKQYEYGLHLNMQYYMEYCEKNGYVTPMEWIEKHKHF